MEKRGKKIGKLREKSEEKHINMLKYLIGELLHLTNPDLFEKLQKKEILPFDIREDLTISLESPLNGLDLFKYILINESLKSTYKNFTTKTPIINKIKFYNKVLISILEKISNHPDSAETQINQLLTLKQIECITYETALDLAEQLSDISPTVNIRIHLMRINAKSQETEAKLNELNNTIKRLANASVIQNTLEQFLKRKKD